MRIVRSVEKPSSLDAAICMVEVLKGGMARRDFRSVSIEVTA